MNTPAKTPTATMMEIAEEVLMRGNWADLTPRERVDHNIRVCKSLGLNHLTNPFGYIMLGGKLVFYAKKDATDQLRKLHGISVEIVSQEIADGLLTVTARATDKTGRVDTDIGVVPFNKNLASEIAANTRMKAVTKAKRRVTLSISGLGFLDETEVEPSDDDPASWSAAHPDLANKIKAAATDDDLIAEHDPPVEPRPYKITAQSWRLFSEILKTELARAETKSDIFEWLELNKANLNAMKEKFPTMYESLGEAIEAAKAEPT